MDVSTLGAALAIVKSIPETAASAAIAAQKGAETAASTAENARDRAEQAALDAASAAYGDIGLVVSNGQLCARVERTDEE